MKVTNFHSTYNGKHCIEHKIASMKLLVPTFKSNIKVKFIIIFSVISLGEETASKCNHVSIKYPKYLAVAIFVYYFILT